MRALTHSLRGCGWLVVLALFAVSCSTSSSSAPGDQPTTAAITPEEVKTAQDDWCKGLLAIAAASEQTYRQVANDFIDKAYDFNGRGQVFFRPTLAYAPHAFRTDKAGTLSYFIGGNPNFPNDGNGFAREPWAACDATNIRLIQIPVPGDIALSMGPLTLTDRSGKKTMVDKTFAFRKQGNQLKLIVHMSAKSNEAPTPTPTPCP